MQFTRNRRSLGAKCAVIVAVLCLVAPLAVAQARAATLTVLTSGGLNVPAEVLAPAFEHRTGIKIQLIHGASMGATPTSIPSRLQRGEAADVVLLASESLDGLIQTGLVTPGSRVDIARSFIAMVVRHGSPRPDISTVAALKQTLLAAKSIGYSTSASGEYLSHELFPRLGIADQMQRTAVMVSTGPVGEQVAAGKLEIGFQQMSELKPIAGIDIVGPLPDGAQQVTIFSAGIAAASKQPDAARSLISFLASSDAAKVVRDAGLEPIK